MSKDLIERLSAAAIHSEMGRKPDHTSIFRVAVAEIERLQSRIADLERENAELKGGGKNEFLQDAIIHLQSALDEAVNLKIDLVRRKALKDAARSASGT